MGVAIFLKCYKKKNLQKVVEFNQLKFFDEQHLSKTLSSASKQISRRRANGNTHHIKINVQENEEFKKDDNWNMFEILSLKDEVAIEFFSSNGCEDGICGSSNANTPTMMVSITNQTTYTFVHSEIEQRFPNPCSKECWKHLDCDISRAAKFQINKERNSNSISIQCGDQNINVFQFESVAKMSIFNFATIYLKVVVFEKKK